MASLNKPLGITSGADMFSTHSQTTVFGFRHPRSSLVCRNRGPRCARLTSLFLGSPHTEIVTARSAVLFP